MSLFWRVFAANAAVLIAGALVLDLVPGGRLHGHAALVDLGVVAGGLLVMLAVNGLLLRRLLHPLARLTQRMETADLLRGGRRAPVAGRTEIGALERTFDEMLERLERERRSAGTYALLGQEEERKRLARGLHDEVGQSMTAVLLQLKRLASTADGEQLAQLTEAQDVVRRSLDDVRRLAQELRPELLDHLGLNSALEELGGRFEHRTHLHVSRRLARDLPGLDPSVELALYRVAQESLTNVARHARASEVSLSLERRDGSVVLRVVDDGDGFGPGDVEGGGLRGIRERALIVGGTAAIGPGPGKGVEIRVEVPVGEG